MKPGCTLFALILLAVPSLAAKLEWTGKGDGVSFYQEANWQVSGGGAVSGNPLANNVAITYDLAFAGNCPNAASELTLGLTSLQISGGHLTMANGGGMRGGSLRVDGGGSYQGDWIRSSSVALANGTVTLRGVANPLSSTIISCTGNTWSVVFTNKTPTNIKTEELSKLLINGAVAADGVNCVVAVSGATGSIITPKITGDSDQDGLADEWEMKYFGNLDQTATGDPDDDKIDNATELAKGTKPNSSDTDGDGLPDGVETGTGIFVSGLDTGTDPLAFNTDGDRVGDGAEVRMGTNPVDSASQPNVPNVVFILTDDLGYNHLSCYGQQRLVTRNIDSLATDGIRFTNAYAGCTVCGPSRSSLMTGLHSGHIPYKINGVHVDITSRTPTVAEIFKKGGYMTGVFGKWGIGGSGSGQTPNDRGFDRFYGMLDQGHGHRHYPSYLIEDHVRVVLGNTVEANGNTSADPAQRVRHTHDAFTDAALNFIDAQKDHAFFCYVAFTLPHTEIIATPEVLNTPEFNPNLWPETYVADTESHVRQTQPHRNFGAELRMIDNSVGAIIAKLAEHHLTDNTLVIFTSDNGGQLQSVWGAAPSVYFNANGILRGGKEQSYEGGLRIPFVAKWPGHIPAGVTSSLPTYFADFLPTVCDLLKLPPPPHTDGLSYLPTLTGNSTAQKIHPYLFWSHRPNASTVDHAVRAGRWKAVKRGANAVELYNLESDPSETTNVAGANPSIAAEMQKIINREYVPDLTVTAPSRASPAYPNHPPSLP